MSSGPKSGKIAVTTTGSSMEAPLVGRFGKAPCFLLHDLDARSIHAVDNPAKTDGPNQDSGGKAARFLAESGVTHVVTGHCGAKAFQALSNSGIPVYITDAPTVGVALAAFKAGILVPAAEPDSEAHWTLPPMRTSLDCLPCLMRQALDATRLVTRDPGTTERIMRQALKALSEEDLHRPPPAVAQPLHRLVRDLTGAKDPFKPAKDRFNDLARSMLPGLRERLKADPDPFALAVRLAIAGNVIDLGAKSGLSEDDASAAVVQALEESLSGDLEAFRRDAAKAGSILYLADNAGEIFFDRLLIEQLAPSRVTVAVRGSCVLNDATLKDALAAGLHQVAEIVDNGSDAPGTLLPDCGKTFLDRFAEADLIISKGQGNYESLSGEVENIYYLFKVKCGVIADRTRARQGEHLLVKGEYA